MALGGLTWAARVALGLGAACWLATAAIASPPDPVEESTPRIMSAGEATYLSLTR